MLSKFSGTDPPPLHDTTFVYEYFLFQIEISSIESKASIVYLKEKEPIPKDSEEKDTSTLYCRRFYDPYK